MSDAGQSMSDAGQPSPVLLVTGMSGGGKTTALKALEDFDYEVVDNIPLSLLPSLLPAAGAGEGGARRPLAIGIDIRTRDFGVPLLLAELERLAERSDVTVRVLFIDCDDAVLHRRYSETRHRHPLAGDRPVMDGIQHERRLVSALRDRADEIIDTTDMTVADLKRTMQARFGRDRPTALTVAVMSFGFRRGLPREADLVFDVRFLANPHYDPVLRPLTGQDGKVGAFVAADPDFKDFFANLTGLLAPLLPRYAAEGKSYLTIAVGCTGGKHRSVFVAERLAAWLVGRGERVQLLHRDMS